MKKYKNLSPMPDVFEVNVKYRDKIQSPLYSKLKELRFKKLRNIEELLIGTLTWNGALFL